MIDILLRNLRRDAENFRHQRQYVYAEDVECAIAIIDAMKRSRAYLRETDAVEDIIAKYIERMELKKDAL